MPLKPKTLSACIFGILILIMISTSMTSCYSVRLVNRHGSAEEDLLNTTEGFWRHKKVHTIDTVISLKLIQGEFFMIEACESGGFHSLEYKTTLGHILLAGITLGRKRKVKVIYSCLLDDDQFND